MSKMKMQATLDGMTWWCVVGSAFVHYSLTPCPPCLYEDLHERPLCSGLQAHQ